MEMPDPLHRSILAVDVERFSDSHRNGAVQLRIRDALYRLLEQAFAAASVPWDTCVREDRGDGAIILVPPAVSTVLLLDPLLAWITAALDRHNRTAELPERFRLRFALHAGAVLADGNGYAGDAIILACRLLDAPPLREALRRSTSDVAAIVSDLIYQDIVRPGYRGIDPAGYHPVEVTVKTTAAHAWIHAPGADPASNDRVRPAGAEPGGKGVNIHGTATGTRSTGVHIGTLDIH